MWKKEPSHQIKDKGKASKLTKGKDRISKISNNKIKMWQDSDTYYWSNFKPEFSGKPEEDAEAHLLHSNDWMNAHHFLEDVKVQRLYLTLLGETGLWYQSIEPLGNTTWPQLQNLFRQRYSKLGNTCEQLFHTWISFTFDENTETIDSYVMQIRQVAALLGYGEPQVLEVFKNTLPTELYWILFPIEDFKTGSRNSKENVDQGKVR